MQIAKEIFQFTKKAKLMKSSNLYSQLKSTFKIVSKDMHGEEIKRILRMCLYYIHLRDVMPKKLFIICKIS